MDFVVYRVLEFMGTSTDFKLIGLIHFANLATYHNRYMLFNCQFFVMLTYSLDIDVHLGNSKA